MVYDAGRGGDAEPPIAVLRSELGRRFWLRAFYMALGLICVSFGVAMLLLGYAGLVDFHLNMGTVFEARLGNAGPGLVLTIIGLAYSWLAATGFKIEFNMREDGWDFVGHSGRTRRT